MTNTVTITEQNNTVSILEDAPVVTPDPWYQDLKSLPTSSGSATVTADATPHTKGAWTEIIASNSNTTSAIFVRVTAVGVSSQDTATLVDIGTGDAGSETVIAGNIAVGGAFPAGYAGINFVLPIQVSSGTRIAVRTQAKIGSDTATVDVETYALGESSAVPTSVDVLGTSTATSEGTAVAVNSAYTEIVASTSQSYDAVVLVPSMSGGYFGSTAWFYLTAAVGASGSETDIARQHYNASSAELIQSETQITSVTDVSIPAGSRIAVKRNDSANGVDVTVIGVPSA